MTQRSPITTHVLDTATGTPASGVDVVLSRRQDAAFVAVAKGRTNEDGRITDLMDPGTLRVGRYRITFQTGAYLAARDAVGFYPEVTIEFLVTDPSEHYHIPLLLSPYGYATYRGS